jgi:hypothetical protein
MEQLFLKKSHGSPELFYEIRSFNKHEYFPRIQ